MAYEEIFDLSVLNRNAYSRKCQYLGKPMLCTVGGDAHALCWHEAFHARCPFKLKFHEKHPHKRIHHPADS